MSEKGYFVSTGSYSDYSVVAVFSTREKAEAFVESHNRLGSFYRTADGTWAPPKTLYDSYEIEETDLDPTFGDRGCYIARIVIENTHPATMASFTKYHDPWYSSSYWTEDADASQPATAVRSPWHGSIDIEGFGVTREAAFVAADSLRQRVMSGEVDPPFPEWWKGAQ